MTTLVFQAADSLVGGIAGAATSLAGNAIAQAVAGGSAKADTVRVSQGPRLTEMGGLTSTEGAPIPRLYGRARLGGQLIWATRFEEVANTTTTVERQAKRGGKSFGSPGPSTTTTTTTYSYFANLAVGLCEGPVALVRRIWADGREIDLATLTVRVHPGDESQPADPLIVAKEGPENAPAYRGLAYVVFEHLPLAPYGNRVPQFSFEVVRPVGALNGLVRSVCLIPGSTEFGYDTVPVMQALGLGAVAPENVHQLQRPTDAIASLDALQALCPNLERVSLVVSWFGDDLRAGLCSVRPKVDLSGKATSGADWTVSGLTRAAAAETSRAGASAAYGGTPSDGSVIRLIRHLKARGLAVTLYPFLMMDVPADNALPDPHSGTAGQPPYPWRGRITCDPAPGSPGSVDGSGAAAAQVTAFFGATSPADFTLMGDTVGYSGPPEWSLRRLVLHCAHLAVAAGGTDGFVIGSELIGLTRLRDASRAYPAVAALAQLAADVRSVVGSGTKLTYAADWTEYGSHVVAETGEVRFPLDPLWASPAIDAVGIDYYPPISDWRDGPENLDRALSASITDPAYLLGRLGAGEGFDWFYAGDADRAAQIRTPITDGAYGKPWTFRAKDLVGWWANAHVERAGGVETAATAWQPCSKPIWLTEIGVPAVDKGPNGPNVFPDPKSSESALPPFSTGSRDDLVQLRALQAILSRFDPFVPGHDPAWNPVSPAYGGRMVDPSHTSVWCWDARPFPAFPDFSLVWADSGNHATGHWITGRIEGAPLDRLVSAILSDFGLPATGTSGLTGFVEGYVVDRPMSARDALEPLAGVFGFDASVVAGAVRWRARGGTVEAAIAPDDMVDDGATPILSRSRAQETELPASVELRFSDAEGEYGRAAVASRRLAGSSRRELSAEVAAVTRRAEAQRLADAWLQDLWAARETASFSLSPRALALTPGDVVSIPDRQGTRLHLVVRVVDGAVRRVETRAVEPAVFRTPSGEPGAVRPRQPPPVPGQPAAIVMDLPVSPVRPEPLQYIAVAADPWPGAVALWRSGDGASFSLHDVLPRPAVIGRTLLTCPAGPLWRWDRASLLEVELSSDALSSVGQEAALAGANLAAIRGPDGAWEILSAESAELIGPRRYRLSGLIRGLAGTEAQAGRSVPAGADLVLLDGSVRPLTTDLADLGRSWIYRAGPIGRDHSDPSYSEFEATAGPAALLPLAPVAARAARTPDGVRISWIRRTRVDGDSWNLADVPLGEDGEAYEVDVLLGTVVLRTLSSAEPALLYPASAELADFGAPQTALALRLFQLSRVVGRGQPCDATIPILPIG